MAKPVASVSAEITGPQVVASKVVYRSKIRMGSRKGGKPWGSHLEIALQGKGLGQICREGGKMRGDEPKSS